MTFDTNRVSDAPVREGDYVRIRCQVMANPAISHIVWALNGRPLTAGADRSHFMDSSNRTLVINYVDKSDAGRYQCTAESQLGKTTSALLILDVHCKLIIYN